MRVYLTQIFQGHSCSVSSHLTSSSCQAYRWALGGLSAPQPPPPLNEKGMGGEADYVGLDLVHLSSVSQQEIDIITQKLSMLGSWRLTEKRWQKEWKEKEEIKRMRKIFLSGKTRKATHPSKWSVNLWGMILLTVTKQPLTLASSGMRDWKNEP